MILEKHEYDSRKTCFRGVADAKHHEGIRAERINKSLDFDSDVDLSPEWEAEIDRRCREIDEGTVALIYGDEVFKKAYARLS